MSFNTVEISEYTGNLVEYFKIGPISGTTYRYAGGTRTVTLATGNPSIDGTYAPHPISIGDLEHTRDAKSLEVPIVVPRDNVVAQLFRGTLPDVKIPIVVYHKHETDTEVITWWQGTIQSCEFRESTATFTCRPTLGSMAKNGLRYRFQIQCNWQIYSTRCGLNPNDYKSAVTVSSVSGLNVTVSGMPVVADGYYNGGYIQHADGSKRFIANHVGSVLTLIMPFVSLVATDAVDIFAGDDHTHTTCRDKFTVGKPAGRGNIDRFYGFFTTASRNPFTQGGLTQSGSSSFPE